MRKKDVERLIASMDEQAAEPHIVLSEEEHERILRKISQRMPQHSERTVPEPVISHPGRRIWLSRAVTAAACIAVFGGTFAGLFWLRSHAPVQPSDSETSSVIEVIPADPSHAVGERYALPNLTESGTLWLTVTEVTREDGQYRIELLLESEDAVSCAKSAMGDGELFFAENFQLTAAGADGSRRICAPCGFAADGQPESGLPYAFRLRPGEQCRVTLRFQPEEALAWQLVSSLAPGAPFTMITEE